MLYKKIYFNILIFLALFFLLSCSSCSNEVDPESLPSFQGITTDENTIFLVNAKDMPNLVKIYAVDTSNDKKIYTYEFKRSIIWSIAYDSFYNKNLYLILDSKALNLDLNKGSFSKFDLPYKPGAVTIINDKLFIIPEKEGIKNVPLELMSRNLFDNKIEYITIPEGSIASTGVNINNNVYLSIWFITQNTAAFYNLTTAKMINGNIFNSEQNYWAYQFYSNSKYVFAAYSDNENSFEDVYYVNSLEPTTDSNYLFTVKGSPFLDLYEKDNKLYLVGRDLIEVRNKDNVYSVEKTKKLNGDSLYADSYCKNGYIWLVSEDNDGAYKINMDDLIYKVIK